MQDIILFGPQGSGKGTQAVYLKRRLRAKTIATGEIARRLSNEDSANGREAKRILSAGDLLPDSLFLPAVEDALLKHLIFDGFPRTLKQAKWLSYTLNQIGRPAPVAIILNITQAEAIKRLNKRLMCPVCHTTFNPRNTAYHNGVCPKDGAKLIRRSDDDPEVVRHRLHQYRLKSRGIKSFYRRRGDLVTVNGKGTILAVWQRLQAAAEKALGERRD